MSKKRVLRCFGCGRRIREGRPYVGLGDHDTGQELPFCAKPDCAAECGRVVLAAAGKGKVFVARHYHVCPDPNPGYGCSAGCFVASEAGGHE